MLRVECRLRVVMLAVSRRQHTYLFSVSPKSIATHQLPSSHPLCIGFSYSSVSSPTPTSSSSAGFDVSFGPEDELLIALMR